ncbi:hypothetical protein ANCDUO_15283 [Ancylostoma duodenale]|uniref:CUB domain-containing protein n=1 Tax=Ancylostoma duodenale TaxID=51022 RepID=A0A0C2G0W3_9BILA|nr:hypothetical protein ANCDUO_15283 [Ancylostoma duodenale]
MSICCFLKCDYANVWVDETLNLLSVVMKPCPQTRTRPSTLETQQLRLSYAVNSGKFDFAGCPPNHDFFNEGQISSPYYPNLHPPNTQCYYYITAVRGNVLRFGGPNATVLYRTGVYTTTQRYASVTFQTDPIVQKTGLRFRYNSAYTDTPCNRDIVLILSGL